MISHNEMIEMVVGSREPDERENLPSASSMERLVNCPGWPKLAAQCPKPADDPLAVQGTAIHKAFETGDDSSLEWDEKDISQRLEGLAKEAFSAWMDGFGHCDAMPEELRERRLWIRNRATLDKVASAQVDRAWVYGTRALVIDAKTGYKEQTPSERNWQIRTQACALWHEYPNLTEIVGGIAASRIRDRLDLSIYTVNDLQAIEREIMHAHWVSSQPDAPRRAGLHCAYCPCQSYCYENAAYAMVVAVPFKNMTPADIVLRIAQLPPSGLAQLISVKGTVEKIFEAASARMKGLPPEVLESIGYRLRDGAVKRSVTDPAKALELLCGDEQNEALLTRDVALALFSPKLPVIEEAIAQTRGISKSSAKEILEERLAPVLERKPNAPSLALIEKKKLK